MVVFSQDKVRAEELQGVVQDLRLAWSSGARDAEFHETWGNQNREFSMENTNISTNIIQYLPIVGCPRLNKVDHSTSWDDWYYWHTDSCLRCGVCPVSSVRVFKRSLKIWSDLLTTCNSLLRGCTCINLYHVVSCCSIAKEHHKTDSHLSGDDKFGGFHSTRGDEGSHASDLTVQGIRAREHRSASKKRFILCFVWFAVVCLPTFGLATNCTSFFFRVC